jgi:NAD-dependent dihydropyrimidine dehydrogenase PreA subunit
MEKGLLIGASILGAIGLFILYAERGRLILPSTKKLLSQHGLLNILNLKALHSYAYVRWTRQYIAFALNVLASRSTEKGRKNWSDRYHGKVLTHDQAKAIVTLDHPIALRDLEQIIPYPTARDLVLHGPPDIVVYECVCRQARTSPCSPSQVCMIIGQPFADFILEHHPTTSRRLTQAEALELLRQEHDRGHLHSAWFKDVMLNRFYAICNCCKCCCGGLEGMAKYQIGNIASSGYVAAVTTAKCDGCGKCERACPFNAMEVNEVSTVRWEKCMGCGVCEGQCPNGAISLVRDEKKGLPFDVRTLR